jgi:hypothetical protein
MRRSDFFARFLEGAGEIWHNPRNSLEGAVLGVLERVPPSSKALVEELRNPRELLEGAGGWGLESAPSWSA